MRLEPFSTGCFYHVYNRGVDKRRIFKDPQDFLRFYESLYLFNDANFDRRYGRENERLAVLASHPIREEEREPFVRIAAFILMPNHFHLLLEQVLEEGASRFLHKVCNGYAHYFNNRHGRVGALFESEFKSKRINSDAHLVHLPRYIHLNALDLSGHDWREGEAIDWTEAERLLGEYQWSSHPTFLGIEQLLPVVDLDLIKRFFETPQDYTRFIREWSGRNLEPTITGYFLDEETTSQPD